MYIYARVFTILLKCKIYGITPTNFKLKCEMILLSESKETRTHREL